MASMPFSISVGRHGGVGVDGPFAVRPVSVTTAHAAVCLELLIRADRSTFIDEMLNSLGSHGQRGHTDELPGLAPMTQCALPLVLPTVLLLCSGHLLNLD